MLLQAKRIGMLTLERGNRSALVDDVMVKRALRQPRNVPSEGYLWVVWRAGSYRSSLFHIARLSAAIFRAIVSLALGGLVPAASNRS